jgi:predicted PurR-regulated permease PerM
MIAMNSNPTRILLLTDLGVIAFLFVWFQWRLLLLTFAGVLLAILLRSIIKSIVRHTPLNPTLAYVTTVGGLAGLIALAVFTLGPRFVDQLSQIGAALPQAIAQAVAYLEQHPWGYTVLTVVQKAMNGDTLASHIPSMAKFIVDTVVDFIIIIVIGFFFALNPRRYRDGLLILAPEAYRRRAGEITDEVIETLRWWLLGQMVPMVVLSVATMITLWLFGIKLAFSLGLLTGLMVFVPYAGTILAGIPSVLLAFQRSPRTALYVLILYFIFHIAEGYFLTPLVQRKAVRLPPALTILSEFFFSTFAGILGVAVAAPLAATGIVLIKNLYLHDKRR